MSAKLLTGAASRIANARPAVWLPPNPLALLARVIATLTLADTIIWGAIGFGAVARVWRYLLDRALWIDEAGLALNITERSYAELFLPLGYNQAAPIGFLLVEKALVDLLGRTEYALRLFPLLCGVLSLLLFVKVARRFLDQRAVPFAIVLFAVSSFLITYSVELKQYSSDVLIFLGLLLVGLRLSEDPIPRWLLVGAGAAGSLAVWVSYPAIFGTVSLGLILTTACVVHRDWRRFLRLAPVFLAWGASLVIEYLVSLRHLANHAVLDAMWAWGYVNVPPRSWADVKHIAEVLEHPLSVPLAMSRDIGILTIILGSIALLMHRKGVSRFAILALPIGLTFIAAALHEYPFLGRTILFLVPAAILLIAQGTSFLISRLPAPDYGWAPRIVRLAIASVVTILVLVEPIRATTYLFRNEEIRPVYIGHWYLRADIDEVMNYVARNRASADAIYVDESAFWAFSWYAPQFGFLEGQYTTHNEAIGDWGRTDATKTRYVNQMGEHLQAQAQQGNGRVWVVFSQTGFWGVSELETRALASFDSLWTRQDTFKSRGAAGYLYQIGGVGPG